MISRIHHLNCGTMCPACQCLINGHGSWRQPGQLVCHCLLLETGEGLVLVDTGLGSHDLDAPRQRLGREYLTLFRPALAREETAIAQVRALGHDPRDVRHIITTHLDLDHAGGLADFPHAAVHVLAPELRQILQPTLRDRLRFRSAQFDHKPRWVMHERPDQRWFGFEALRVLPALGDHLLMVPLIGHTKGHVGVAVRENDGWLLHCGDAYYHHSQISQAPAMPKGLALFEQAVQTYPRQRRQNLDRLRALAHDHGDAVTLFCAHDPVELARSLTPPSAASPPRPAAPGR